MRITIRPEHVIVSDTIEANGYQGLTLSLLPKDRIVIDGMESFFITVLGGHNAYQELTPKHFWEITGEIELKKVSTFTSTWKEFVIRITDYRKLTDKERKEQQKEVNEYWENYYEGEE